MKKHLYRAAAATVLGLSLTTGIVAADSGNNISWTGPNSSNHIRTRVKNSARIHNDNDITLTNSNYQTGTSGDTDVSDNTTGGTASSGNVKNDNYTSADVTVSNSGLGGMSDPQGGSPSSLGGSISNTGPGSSNTIHTSVENKLDVSNDNDISITNSNSQTGTSGDATVTDNTHGGNATSGNVTNSNVSKFSISVTN